VCTENRSKTAEQLPTFSDHVHALSDSIRRIKFPPTDRLWLEPAETSPHTPEQLTSLRLRIPRLSRTHWITIFARDLEVRIHLYWKGTMPVVPLISHQGWRWKARHAVYVWISVPG
jgi:hypothetical protein